MAPILATNALDVRSIAGHLCMSVQTLTKLHDVAIANMAGQAVYAKLYGSHVQQLSSAAGSLVLYDSVIDTVVNFSGTIHLHGSSSVGSHGPNVSIIHDP